MFVPKTRHSYISTVCSYLALLLRTGQVLCPNLSTDTGCPLFMVLISASKQILGQCLLVYVSVYVLFDEAVSTSYSLSSDDMVIND